MITNLENGREWPSGHEESLKQVSPQFGILRLASQSWVVKEELMLSTHPKI